ncbi:hypothetical protein F2Q70_00037388 [Brassica cretica]|nr:hypothetical protein F2Q70_00037388 [Brassica cretica]
MHDEFQKMNVSMTESFRSFEATVNHMVEIVRMMKAGDGTASRSSQTVSSPKRRRAPSTRISHQHHTFWSKRRHIPKKKRKKISPKKKRKKTMQTKRRKQQQEIKSTNSVSQASSLGKRATVLCYQLWCAEVKGVSVTSAVLCYQGDPPDLWQPRGDRVSFRVMDRVLILMS